MKNKIEYIDNHKFHDTRVSVQGFKKADYVDWQNRLFEELDELIDLGNQIGIRVCVRDTLLSSYNCHFSLTLKFFKGKQETCINCFDGRPGIRSNKQLIDYINESFKDEIIQNQIAFN